MRYRNSLKHALFYYDQLGWNVIPADGKRPLVKWDEWKTGRIPRELIEEWFGRKYRGANVALVAGSISGVVVIDYDDAPEIPEWVSEVDVWVAKTNRGWHVFARCGSPFSGRRFPELKVDVKGDGGLVILPRSIHPSGIRYEWVIPPTSSVLTDIDLVWAVSGLPDPKEETFTDEERPVKELYSGVPEGERNLGLTRIAGSLFFDGLTLEEVKSVLRCINRRNSPPLPNDEVDRIVMSIYRRDKVRRALLEEIVERLRAEVDVNLLADVITRVMSRYSLDTKTCNLLLRRVDLMKLIGNFNRKMNESSPKHGKVVAYRRTNSIAVHSRESVREESTVV